MFSNVSSVHQTVLRVTKRGINLYLFKKSKVLQSSANATGKVSNPVVHGADAA